MRIYRSDHSNILSSINTDKKIRRIIDAKKSYYHIKELDCSIIYDMLKIAQESSDDEGDKYEGLSDVIREMEGIREEDIVTQVEDIGEEEQDLVPDEEVLTQELFEQGEEAFDKEREKDKQGISVIEVPGYDYSVPDILERAALDARNKQVIQQIIDYVENLVERDKRYAEDRGEIISRVNAIKMYLGAETKEQKTEKQQQQAEQSEQYVDLLKFLVQEEEKRKHQELLETAGYSEEEKQILNNMERIARTVEAIEENISQKEFLETQLGNLTTIKAEIEQKGLSNLLPRANEIEAMIKNKIDRINKSITDILDI